MSECPGCQAAERLGLKPALCDAHLREYRVNIPLKQIVDELPEGSLAKKHYDELVAAWNLQQIRAGSVS